MDARSARTNFWASLDVESQVSLADITDFLRRANNCFGAPYPTEARQIERAFSRNEAPTDNDVYLWSRILLDGVRWGSFHARVVLQTEIMDAIESMPQSVRTGLSAGLVMLSFEGSEASNPTNPQTKIALSRALNASLPAANLSARGLARKWLADEELSHFLAPGWTVHSEAPSQLDRLDTSLPGSEAGIVRRPIIETGSGRITQNIFRLAGRQQLDFFIIRRCTLVRFDGVSKSGWAILDGQGEYVPSLSFGDKPDVGVNTRHVPGVSAIVDDRFSFPNPAHWFLDKAVRVLALKDAGVAFTPVLLHEAPRSVEMLEILGCSEGIYAIPGTAYTFDELIVPSDIVDMRHPLVGTLPGARRLVLDWLQRFSISRSDTLFCSRVGAKKRTLVDESKVIDLLPRGSRVVSLGSLPLKDQISFVLGAKRVVGVHGANMTIAALSDSVSIVEILPPGLMGTHSFYVAQDTWATGYDRYVGVEGVGVQSVFAKRTLSDQLTFDVLVTDILLALNT